MAKQQFNRKPDTEAKRAEIKRRYTWQARQNRKRNDKKPDPARLITLIRLRELERIFQHRYGRLLPDDDAGLDDLTTAAHHIAHLGGDVIKHILAWAHAWAPWLPHTEAEQLARRVAHDPQKFTADVLAWRLRLSAVERTALKITTIGAFDVSKVERAEERKRKDRERKKAKRAAYRSGRSRGRPIKPGSKNASAAGKIYAADSFSMGETSVDVVGSTTPPAAAVGTPSQISHVARVDAAGVVDNPEVDRQRKTRFPSAMRLNKQMMAEALARGFERQRIGNLFEHFKQWNIAMHTYSADWGEVWSNWLDRQVDIETEEYHRQRARAWLERRTAA